MTDLESVLASLDAGDTDVKGLLDEAYLNYLAASEDDDD